MTHSARRAIRLESYLLAVACFAVTPWGLVRSADPSEADPSSPEQKMRRLAALRGKGEEAVPILRDALRDSDPAVRTAAISMLGQEAGRAAVKDIGPFVEDPEATVAVAAVRTLFDLSTDDALPFLEKAFASQDRSVRAAVLDYAGDHRERRLIPQVGSLVSDPYPANRHRAVESLRAIGGPETFPYLMAATTDAHEEVAAAAVSALETLGDPRAVERIGRLATAASPKVRAAVARTLVVLGGESAYRQTIETLLGDSDPGVRAAVLSGFRARPSDGAIPFLEQIQEEPSAAIRRIALAALKANPSAAATRGIERFLEDPDDTIRAAAVLALAARGGGDRLPRIAALRADRSETVRAAVASALGDLRVPEGLATLEGLARDASPEVRSISAVAAGKIGTARGLRLLKRLLGDPDRSVRLEAVRAVGACEGSRASDLLKRAASAGDLEVRVAALEQMGIRGDPTTIPFLEGLLDDPAEAVRRAARSALEAIRAGSKREAR